MEESFGLKAEGWTIQILKAAGYKVIRATMLDDKVHKVDFWVWWDNYWLAIQFSIDRQEVVNGKGTDALHRGIVPSWLNGQELEQAVNGHPELQLRLVAQFWRQVDAIIAVYPQCKLRRPAVPALRGGTTQLTGVRRSR